MNESGKTMKNILLPPVLASIAFFVVGCTTLKDDLPSSTAAVNVHSQGWVDTSSANFHGLAVKNDVNGMKSCITCHGSRFDGGVAQTSCLTCHGNIGSHGEGWVEVTSTAFHGLEVRNNQWDMRPCKTCHGQDYGGGIVATSCRTCHGDPTGPEDCTTCHGAANPAPPRSLNGDTATTVRGVGAHQTHLVAGRIGSSVACSECHIVPASMYATGHVDTQSPAEVIFQGPLGRTASNGVTPDPAFNTSSITCANTYCHGNWRARKSSAPPGSQFGYLDSVMVGLNAVPLWTGGQAEANCGTCHGLPPAGHTPAVISSCVNCHVGIVNSAGEIVDKQKHMNGRINIFGSERDF